MPSTSIWVGPISLFGQIRVMNCSIGAGVVQTESRSVPSRRMGICPSVRGWCGLLAKRPALATSRRRFSAPPLGTCRNTLSRVWKGLAFYRPGQISFCVVQLVAYARNHPLKVPASGRAMYLFTTALPRGPMKFELGRRLLPDSSRTPTANYLGEERKRAKGVRTQSD